MLKVELHAHTSDDPVDWIPHTSFELIDRAVALGYDGLAITLERASELLDEGNEAAGFGSLLGLVESLLDPLEPFADAEERFASLRRRTGRSRASRVERHDA